MTFNEAHAALVDAALDTLASGVIAASLDDAVQPFINDGAFAGGCGDPAQAAAIRFALEEYGEACRSVGVHWDGLHPITPLIARKAEARSRLLSLIGVGAATEAGTPR